MSDHELYIGREQTLIKHYILRHYLERFAHIVGSYWNSITYIDCFSGPWKARSQELKDTSFSIALEELKKARDTHKKLQPEKELTLRCFFLEKNVQAYAKLKMFAESIDPNIAEIQHKNGELENSVSDILNFIKQGSFPFIFIDPTGWTGFAMDVIRPLLRLKPGEVLINFMTGDIKRFVDSPEDQTRESFKQLFGSENFQDKLRGLSKEDREDAMVEEYMRNLRREGNFNYVCSAIVLHPEMDRTRFHLIYGTHHLRGVEVFKKVEKSGMKLQEETRAKTRQRRRKEKTGQGELPFWSDVLHTPYYESLRDRYLTKSKLIVLDMLENGFQVPYDDVWAEALTVQMTWESDLKEWIREWRDSGRLKIIGLEGKQRDPQRGENHKLIWQ